MRLEILYISVTALSVINMVLVFFILKNFKKHMKGLRTKSIMFMFYSALVLFVAFIFHPFPENELIYKLLELLASMFFTWSVLEMYSG
jgi:hypothetical protein